MKIVFATEYYHPFTPGGTPWSLRLLARQLRARGDEVIVVTPNYGAPTRESIDDVPVVRFSFWRRLPPGPALAPVRDHVNPIFHLLFARALVRAARALGAELIHAQEKHALVGASLAGWWLGLPVVLSLRDFGLICPITTCLLHHAQIPADCSLGKLQRECAAFFLDHYIGGGRWRRARVRGSLALLYVDALLKNRLVKRARRVLGVSASILEIHQRADRIRPEQATVVYNLPPTAAPDATPAERKRVRTSFGLPDRPLVLYVGKLSPGKGFPVFVEAVRRVAARRPDTVFVAVGAGSAPAAREGVDLRCFGPRPHVEVEALYTAADVVVHPAVWPEPFSRVLLEAAAFGRPVVGTSIGGTPEAIQDQHTGLLVERGDPEALARAVLRLLDDDGLRRRLGESARRFVTERFGTGAVVDALRAAYAEARR
jgi:glycosyltransferase involved in cell wall biosynthesis